MRGKGESESSGMSETLKLNPLPQPARSEAGRVEQPRAPKDNVLQRSSLGGKVEKGREVEAATNLGDLDGKNHAHTHFACSQ